MAIEAASLRYARSLIELAKNDKDLDQFYSDMSSFQEVCRASREFKILIKSPILKPKDKSKLIYKILGDKLGNISNQLISLLEKKRRFVLMCGIADEFIKLYRKKFNIVTAYLTTAVEAPKSIIQSIDKTLKDKRGCKEVNYITKVDPSILGGYILRIGDRQIDSSLKRKLKYLKVSLENS